MSTRKDFFFLPSTLRLFLLLFCLKKKINHKVFQENYMAEIPELKVELKKPQYFTAL